ncbi:hypothetical protein BCR44DRAFT_1510810, partial [Catenaria anguillulae PL171]
MNTLKALIMTPQDESITDIAQGLDNMEVDAAAKQIKTIQYPPDPPTPRPPRPEMQTKVSGNARDGFKTKRGTRAGKNKKNKKYHHYKPAPKPEAAASAAGGVVVNVNHYHHHHKK